MTIAQILAFAGPLLVGLEPMLLNLEQSTIVPDLQALIAKESSPDLKVFLSAMLTGLDAFAQIEIKKLG